MFSIKMEIDIQVWRLSWELWSSQWRISAMSSSWRSSPFPSSHCSASRSTWGSSPKNASVTSRMTDQPAIWRTKITRPLISILVRFHVLLPFNETITRNHAPYFFTILSLCKRHTNWRATCLKSLFVRAQQSKLGVLKNSFCAHIYIDKFLNKENVAERQTFFFVKKSTESRGCAKKSQDANLSNFL